MKLIAKTQKRTEYLHSREFAYFCADDKANTVCNILNEIKFQNLNENEIWHIYDRDISQDIYVDKKLVLSRNGKLVLRSL